jgi:predicted RNase H-like nuclease (RuvC/YqgF family)
MKNKHDMEIAEI